MPGLKLLDFETDSEFGPFTHLCIVTRAGPDPLPVAATSQVSIQSVQSYIGLSRNIERI